MPTKKQKQKEFLGRAIFKQRFGGNIKDDPKTSGLHTSDIDENAEKAKKMQSVTQFTDFQELFDYANLADKDFSAEKQNAIVITADQQKQQRVMLTKEYPIEIMMKHWNDVTIPRRPPWDENTTGEELHAAEKQYFLEWRRKLAKMEEEKGLLLSPFEKNIEVWRQLWRVVERSEIIVQIVDARNPLLFRNPDLEKYVKEVDEDKINILLINKADLLSKQQRIEWAKYFTANNVEFLFFSANYEKLKMEQKTLEKQKLLKQHIEEEMDLEEQEAFLSESEDSGKEDEEGEQDEVAEYAKVLNREDLLDYLMQFYDEEAHTDEEGNQTRMTIGMVGFPNVGKSSTINVLVGEKKVSVSSTPGKTKHFQTINIDEHIQLCDCPGLVFPTFMSTKAEMICNGLLSIDHMREHNAPVTLLARRIPKEIIEKSYGIVLPKPKSHEDPNRDPTAEEVLQAHATVRGYMTARGTPNESVSAREILKDYVTGLLVYAHSPPGIDPKEFNKTTKILNKKLSTKKTQQREILEEKEEKIHVPVGKLEEGEEEEEAPQENKMETLTIGKKSKKKKKANRKHLEPTVKTYDPLEDPDFRKQEKVVAVTTGKHAKVNFVRPKVYHTVVPVAQLRAAKKQLDKTQALPRTVSKQSNENKE